MNCVFGEHYAKSLASSQTITALDGQTIVEALDRGLRPVDVWEATCDQMGIEPAQRYPLDRDPSPTSPEMEW